MNQTSDEDLLREFQKRKVHIALVKSDNDAITGFLSLEDIVEELIGEVQDEFATEEFIHLSDLINRDGVIPELGEVDKKEAIDRLIKKAAAVYPELNETELVREVWKREAMISTAIGNEMAIPHARVNLSKPVIIFAKSRAGIDFDSYDQLPVKLIFFIITPISAPIIQLRVLAKIAKAAESSIFRQKLIEAKTGDAILKVIRSADFSYSIESNKKNNPLP